MKGLLMENQNLSPKKYNISEIRKIHPKVGMRWGQDEDELLKKSYQDYRVKGGDFDIFIKNLSKQFGRAVGGMKARLAKYFDDVPGWDYSREIERGEIL